MKAIIARTLSLSAFAAAIVGTAHAGLEDYVLTPNAPAHLAKAETLVGGIRAQTYWGYISRNVNGVDVPFNQYGASYQNTVTKWGGGYWKSVGPFNSPYYGQVFVVTNPWENNTVCGNFVTRMLEQAYAWDWSAYSIGGETPTASPNARLYSKAIQNGNGFTKVAKVSDLKAGDILSIDYKSNPNSEADSGHVMMFRKVKTSFITTADAVETKKYRVWVLSIVDSTSQPHDDRFNEEDSRNMLGYFVASSQKGAGIGEFRIITDEAGTNVLGYAWGYLPGVYSKTYTNIMSNSNQNQTDKPLSMGRIKL